MATGNIETLLNAYAAQLPAETAARIRTLDEMPYDAKSGEDPMSLGSVECFLKCFTNMPRTEKLPELSASHSGTLYAARRPEPGTKVAVRFFPLEPSGSRCQELNAHQNPGKSAPKTCV